MRSSYQKCLVILAALLSLTLWSAASACTIERPPVVKLPYESEAEYLARANRLYDNAKLLRDVYSQRNAFDAASSIWLGRVRESGPSPKFPTTLSSRGEGTRAVVEPLFLIRGSKPTSPQILDAYFEGGLCGPEGDGGGAFTEAGELVFVVSVPANKQDQAPGIVSFSARSVVIDEFLLPLREYLKQAPVSQEAKTRAEAVEITDLRGTSLRSPEKDRAKCAAPADADGVFWFGQNDVKPGERVKLVPKWIAALGSLESASPECIQAVKLSPGSPALVSADGQSIQVKPDAEHGTVFDIVARVAGKEIDASIRVLHPARNPLAGRWTEKSRNCEIVGRNKQDASDKPLTPIRELRIHGDGSFSLTFEQVFEGYRDYWGRYSFVLETARLELTIDGGNRLPPDRFDGLGLYSAKESQLLLIGFNLGGSAPDEITPLNCTYEFSRMQKT